ncbi:MAG: hypothetical protein ACTII7_04845 [Galactobacter sp.]
MSNRQKRQAQQEQNAALTTSSGEGTSGEVARARIPGSVVIVSVCVILEAVGVLVAAVFAAQAIGQSSSVSVAGRVFLLVLLLLVAVWQGVVAFKHLAGRAWTRSAVVVWQLFQVIVSIYYISNAPGVGDWAGLTLGVGMLLVGGVALVTVFSPATRAWLEPDDAPR